MASQPTDEILERVYRRANAIKRRRRWTWTPIASAALVIVLAVPFVFVTSHHQSSQVVTDAGPSRPTPAPGSVIYAVGWNNLPDAPSIVQIDSASMGVLAAYPVPRQQHRTTLPGGAITGGASPESLRLSPDGSTLYFRLVGGSCGGPIDVIDVNDPGSAHPVIDPPEGTGVGDFVLTSDGNLVWYRCPTAGGGGLIMVRDLASGMEYGINYDIRWGDPAMSVSPDGSTLAVEMYPNGRLSPEVRLVVMATKSDTLIRDTAPLKPPDGCTYSQPRFNPGTGELYLLEHCATPPGQGGRLVAVDLRTGMTTRTILVLDDDAALVDYSIDATGEHLIYSLTKAMNATGLVGDGAEPQTFRLDDGQNPVRLQLPLQTVVPPSFRSGPNLEW